MADDATHTHQKPGLISKLDKSFSRLLSAIVLVFCFLLFPLFIIHSTVGNLFEMQTSALRQKKIDQMDEKLTILKQYSDNSRYIHSLLKKVFEYAQMSDNPTEYLRQNFDNLKSQYPEMFSFIAWNAKGDVIRELTDQQRYAYVMSRLYILLNATTRALKLGVQMSIAQIDEVKQNINLVRHFLGKIFIVDYLRQPYLHGFEAGPVLSDFGADFSHFWFHIGDKISFLTFINEDFLSSYDGLQKVISVVQRQSPEFSTGYTIAPYFELNQVSPTHRGYLTRAIAEFENSSEPFFENDKLLIAVSMAQPELRTFCIYPKETEIWSVKYRTNKFVVQAAVGLFLFYLLLWFHLKFRMQFVSIRYKLLGLFLFASAAPLSILGFIAHDYLISTREASENEVRIDSLKLLREFDARYDSVKQEYSDKLNRIIGKINTEAANRELNEQEIALIRSLGSELKTAETYLIDKNGRQILHYRAPDRQQDKTFDFIMPLGESIIKFTNGIIIRRSSSDIFSSLISPESAEFVRKAYVDQGKISKVSLGNEQKLCYWRILGNKDQYENRYFLIFAWDEEVLQELYINLNFSTINTSYQDIDVVAARADESRHWVENGEYPRALAAETAKHGLARDSFFGRININNQNYLYATSRGQNLDTIFLSALYTESLVDEKIQRIRSIIAAGAVMSLLLAMAIALTLSRQFLVPVSKLGEATMAIGARNFRHRIETRDQDEFGLLSQVFNNVIEGLGELEVARIVQESLFPGNAFSAGSLSLYGQSVVMTTLGGDYYDVFAIDDKSWGIVIGDVAGHGVAAGLMMAMAKAGVLTASDEEKTSSTLLTSRLHKIFYTFKQNSPLKRMMTFQCFVVAPDNGSFSFVNAGHCFPIHVRPKQGTAQFIEQAGTPLGVSAKARYQSLDFTIEPGEALLLYTDGIAEACNNQGESYGFERLKQLALKAYDSDPETYYNNVYEAYKSWIVAPDDDLTLIMITRQHENLQ